MSKNLQAKYPKPAININDLLLPKVAWMDILPIEFIISWTDFVNLDILRENMLGVNFTEYIDKSGEILNTVVPAANNI